MTPPKKKPTKKGGHSEQNIERYSVPLFQLPGNMELMLENVIPCIGVSFIPYKDADLEDGDGVVMVLHFGEGDKEKAYEMGFRTAPSR